ncbi:MAG: hypothetical protein HRF46_13520 [Acidobacteriota bacterium]|jgi:hypothetical protein
MFRSLLVAALLFAPAGAVAEEYFVVGVAQRQGQEGSWWGTELWVTNTTASTGGYAVVFLPVGQSNLEGLRVEPTLEDIPPAATVLRKDVVPEGGLGALRVVTTPGVMVYCRVFNAAGRGSFGLGVPPLTRAAATRPGEIAHLVGLRRSPQFRTNVGVMNLSTDNGGVRIRLVSERGEVVGEQPFRLAPGAYLQLTDILHAFGQQRAENVRAEVSGTVPFVAYAAVIDSRSGAPTLVQPLR